MSKNIHKLFLTSFLSFVFFFSFFQSSQAGFFDWFGWFGKNDLQKAKEVVSKVDQNTLYTLSISKSGSGAVTSDDGKINCGKQCKASYPVNSKIVLKAEAGDNYKFERWNGCDKVSDGKCQTTLNKSKMIVAKFVSARASFSSSQKSSSASKSFSSKSSQTSSKASSSKASNSKSFSSSSSSKSISSVSKSYSSSKSSSFVSQDTNDIIILEEKTAGEILSPPPAQGERWDINTLNFLKQFYQTHGDDYDFIVLFPTKPIYNNNSVRITVDTVGTGVEKRWTQDSRYANYTKRLKSIAELNYYFIWEGPWFNKKVVDKVFLKIMMHEITHHWCCHISGWPGEGDDYTEITQGIHWPNNLDLFYGDARYIDIMGYGQWIRNNGKDICVGQTDTTQWKFSKLTQYLMGLISPNQVDPVYLYEPKETPNRPVCGKYQTINTYMMTIENIIQINGVRIPSYENSQKNFRIVFVVVTPKGEKVEQEFIDYVKLYKQALPDAWGKATDQNSHIIY